MKYYWIIRHYFWRRRELRFVRDIQFYLADHDRLYIHPEEGGPATILVTPYDPLPNYNHTHVEGNK